MPPKITRSTTDGVVIPPLESPCKHVPGHLTLYTLADLKLYCCDGGPIDHEVVRSAFSVELYVNGAGDSITITTGGTYYKWVSSIVAQAGTAGTILASAGTDNFVVGASGAGKYLVAVSASFKGGKDKIVRGAVHKNSVKQDNLAFSRFVDSTTDRGSASITGMLILADEDIVDFRVTSDDDGDVVIIYDVNLLAIRLDS